MSGAELLWQLPCFGAMMNKIGWPVCLCCFVNRDAPRVFSACYGWMSINCWNFQEFLITVEAKDSPGWSFPSLQRLRERSRVQGGSTVRGVHNLQDRGAERRVQCGNSRCTSVPAEQSTRHPHHRAAVRCVYSLAYWCRSWVLFCCDP